MKQLKETKTRRRASASAKVTTGYKNYAAFAPQAVGSRSVNPGTLLPPRRAIKSATATLIEELRAGLPVRRLEDLQSALGVSMDKLAALLGISKSTLHRRQAGDRLSTVESDRVVRFERLMLLAIDTLESEDDARRWLSTPQFGLGGAVPLDYAQTEVGAREVEDLLGRIKYGVYS